MRSVRHIIVAFGEANRWRARALELQLRRVGDHVAHFISSDARKLATQEPRFGLRLERHLFGAEFGLPMVMGTWVRINPGFDRLWDVSLFGIRTVETDWI